MEGKAGREVEMGREREGQKEREGAERNGRRKDPLVSGSCLHSRCEIQHKTQGGALVLQWIETRLTISA